jgi:hypothetical protein
MLLDRTVHSTGPTSEVAVDYRPRSRTMMEGHSPMHGNGAALRHSEHAHLLSDIEKLTLPILGSLFPLTGFLEPNRRFGLSVGTHQYIG